MPAPAESLLCLIRAPGAVVAVALASSLAGCADDGRLPTGPDAPAASVAAAAVAPLVFRAVSAGDTHTCGVTKDNRAWCWGGNFSGQLGDGTTINRVLPTLVAGGLSFRSVTAGRAHSCGITTDDLAYCWGYGGYGAVGDGEFSIPAQPVAVAGGHRFAELRAGKAHLRDARPPARLGAGAATAMDSSATTPMSRKSRR